jgi:hypothetical protein
MQLFTARVITLMARRRNVQAGRKQTSALVRMEPTARSATNSGVRMGMILL